MKSLTLLRHAKSERDSPDGSDFARSLNERGRADAARMGEEMRRLGLRHDLVLASPAQRVVETLEGVGGMAPRFDERIYNASTNELLGIVQEVDDSIDRLMLVGHNPGFERLAGQLTDGVLDVPTGALVEIELPIDHWREAGKGSGRLVRFIKPKELDQS
ncbi:MAG: SixA phosphatase family protein [Sphingomicrobium sp.]